MGYLEAMSNAHRALRATNQATLTEESLRAMKVLWLLEDMAPDLLRINPAAAETAALVMVRVRSKMSRLSDYFWMLTLD